MSSRELYCCIAWVLLCLLAGPLRPAASASGAYTCPGLLPISSQVVCTAPCQAATCTALAAFHDATNRSAKSWRFRAGWSDLENQTCSQLVATTPTGGLPAYCNWFGLTCCTPPLVTAGYCTNIATVIEVKVEVNGLNGSVNDPAFQQSIGKLHACGLKSLTITGNALWGSLTDFWGDLVNLRVLGLAKNLITGTIPDAMRNLTSLMQLQLNRNPMHGTLPEWIGELQAMQWLGLSAFAGYNADGTKGLVGTPPAGLGSLPQLGHLLLDDNSLEGSLPAGLCRPTINILILRRNQITGDISQFLPCTDLLYLDISFNKFAGVLPDIATWGWPHLANFDISNNAIEGTLPSAFYRLPWASYVNMAHNRLNGTISTNIKQMPYLLSLDLHNNSLVGSIDDSMWYVPRLSNLDLSSNKLTGTLSSAIGLSYYAASLLLDNNNFTGQIPPELGYLSSLMSVDLRNNSLTCGGQAHDRSEQCVGGQQLPCFLSLSDISIPRPDASYMECHTIERKARAAAVQDCNGTTATQLDGRVTDLADETDRTQTWQLDPSYYHFQGCKCLEGYREVWTNHHTILTCVHATRSAPTWTVPVTVVVSIVGFMLLAAILLWVWFKMMLQLRRKWQREKELLKNRQRGVPSRGPAAIVVTDVEKYSELMQHNAAMTTRALGIHNAILRRAVTGHAGYVVEQEGDSWSVAFHRPVDAVAFCLQVQQALQKSQWPGDLSKPSALVPSPERHSEPSHATAEVLVHQAHPGPTRAVGPKDTVGALNAAGRGQEDDQEHTTQSARRTLSFTQILQYIPYRARRNSNLTPGSSNRASQIGIDAVVGQTSGPLEQAAGEAPTSRSSFEKQQKLQRPSRRLTAESDWSHTMTTTGRATGSVTINRDYKGGAQKAQQLAVKGLKVRMGVASGVLPAGSDITSSALLQLAKAVSEMANGGQTLLDCSTAVAVRDSLAELGGVTHKGYNEQRLSEAYRLQATRRANRWFHCHLRFLLRSVANQEREPLLLDMGQYWVPSLVSIIQEVVPITAANRSLLASDRPSFERHKSTVTAVVRSSSGRTDAKATSYPWWACSEQAPIAAAAATLLTGVEVAGSAVQVHSIAPRCLHARSKVWKGGLNLRQATRQLIKGYFQAPGTIAAYLSPAGFLDVERPLLPAVTVVFAAVEGGKALVRKKSYAAGLVHKVVTRIMQALLLSFPDGYLCREQEGVLQYMLAFSEPTRATEWCLVLQELMRYVPWPREVWEAFALTATRSRSDAGARVSGSAAGVGERPALRMGLAEGTADAISPDHLGHADYFGTSVNLAARIMSVAGQAGQVIMSLEMAQGIFSAWRYEAEIGLYSTPASPRPPEPQARWQQFSLSGASGSQVSHVTSHPAADGSNAGAVDGEPAVHTNHVQVTLAEQQKSAGQNYTRSSAKAATMEQPSTEYEGTYSWSGAGPDGASLVDKEDEAAVDKPSSPRNRDSSRQQLAHEEGARHSVAIASPRMQAALHTIPQAGSADSEEDNSQHLASISAQQVGTYAFKGCGVMDLVCLISDAVPAMDQVLAVAPPRGSKGLLVSAASGPVVGLQDYAVMLPNVLPQFKQAWDSGKNLNIGVVPQASFGAVG